MVTTRAILWCQPVNARQTHSVKSAAPHRSCSLVFSWNIIATAVEFVILTKLQLLQSLNIDAQDKHTLSLQALHSGDYRYDLWYRWQCSATKQACVSTRHRNIAVPCVSHCKS